GHGGGAVGVQRTAAPGGVEHRRGPRGQGGRPGAGGVEAGGELLDEGGGAGGAVEDPPAAGDLPLEDREGGGLGGAEHLLDQHGGAGLREPFAAQPVGQAQDQVGALGEDELLGDL